MKKLIKKIIYLSIRPFKKILVFIYVKIGSRIVLQLFKEPSNQMFLSHSWMNYFLEDTENIFNKMLLNDGMDNKQIAKVLSLESVEALMIERFNFKYHMGKMFIKDEHQPKNNKNILFVTVIMPSVYHGGGIRIFDMMYELSKRGFNVSLFTVSSDSDDEYTKSKLEEICDEVVYTPYFQFAKQDLHKWAVEGGKDFSSTYYVWPQASDLISNNRAVFGKTIFEFIECTTLRLWMDIKKLILENKEISSEILMQFWADYCHEKKAIAGCDELICVTPKDKEFIDLIHGTKNTTVISTGISQTEILDKLKDTESEQIPFSAGFIGNYGHYPNLDGLIWYFINIHQKIVNEVPNYKFYVYGMGDISDVKSRFQHFSGSVEWVGPVDSVVEALIPVKIMLCPLISGAGLRGKIIQYASLKKPIVSTSIGACGTPFEHNASALISDVPEEFALNVIKLLSDEKSCDELASSANQIARSFYGWEKHIDQLEGIL